MTPEPSPLRILLVDDEAGIRQGLGDLLRTHGHEVRTADSADQAIERLRHHPTDLLITDLQMEGLDGLDLVRTAREIDPEIAAMVVTGYASLEVALEAVRLGLVDLIEKPFRARRVLEAVAAAPRRRRASVSEDGSFRQPLDRAAPGSVAGHVGVLLAACGFRNPARAELQAAVAQVLRTVLDESTGGATVRTWVEAGSTEARIDLELPVVPFQLNESGQRLIDLMVDDVRRDRRDDVLRLSLVRSGSRQDPDVCRVRPEDAESDLSELRTRVAATSGTLPIAIDLSECEALSASALETLDTFIAQTRMAAREVEVVHISPSIRRAATALGMAGILGPTARPEHLIRSTLWS
jgi:CheY-like chemotaxis protein